MPAPSIAIIDPGMGNLRSVLRAFQHCGADAEIIKSPDLVAGKDALIFPGQGAIVDCMKHLVGTCLLYTSPSPRDRTRSRMPSSA